MNLEVITSEQYSKLCNDDYFYDSARFNELNKDKVEKVIYLMFKNYMVLAAGEIDETLLVPYSAPFGNFEKIRGHLKIKDIEEAFDLLESFAKNEGIKIIRFRFPPLFHDEDFLSKIENVLWRRKYKLLTCDLNYIYDYSNNMDYYMRIRSKAKSTLKKALKNDFILKLCVDDVDKEQSYNIIKEHHNVKQYPLKMTFSQVMDTSRLTNIDFFILYFKDKAVASAIVFKVNKEVYQLIYWGNLKKYDYTCPMNCLAYYLYLYYEKKEIKVFDLGPATENGIPNYGLCDFKESIGCTVTTKKTYELLL